MGVNKNVFKKIYRNHKEKTDRILKTEEIWLIRVFMYQKGYSESALQYKSQRTGGNDVVMPLMWYHINQEIYS